MAFGVFRARGCLCVCVCATVSAAQTVNLQFAAYKKKTVSPPFRAKIYFDEAFFSTSGQNLHTDKIGHTISFRIQVAREFFTN